MSAVNARHRLPRTLLIYSRGATRITTPSDIRKMHPFINTVRPNAKPARPHKRTTPVIADRKMAYSAATTASPMPEQLTFSQPDS